MSTPETHRFSPRPPPPAPASGLSYALMSGTYITWPTFTAG